MKMTKITENINFVAKQSKDPKKILNLKTRKSRKSSNLESLTEKMLTRNNFLFVYFLLMS